MGVPNFLKNHLKDRTEEHRLDPIVDPQDILLDNVIIRYVTVDDEQVPYIALSMAEEAVFSSTRDITEYTTRMIAKAYETQQRFGLNDASHQYSKVASLISEELTFMQKDAVCKAVAIDRNVYMDSLSRLLAQMEESHYASQGVSHPRDKNSMDYHLRNIYMFEKFPFSLMDLQSMTRAQYLYYTGIVQETQIRAFNDHEYSTRASNKRHK
jgi:hypothetical protein